MHSTHRTKSLFNFNSRYLDYFNTMTLCYIDFLQNFETEPYFLKLICFVNI